MIRYRVYFDFGEVFETDHLTDLFNYWDSLEEFCDRIIEGEVKIVRC